MQLPIILYSMRCTLPRQVQKFISHTFISKLTIQTIFFPPTLYFVLGKLKKENGEGGRQYARMFENQKLSTSLLQLLKNIVISTFQHKNLFYICFTYRRVELL